MSFVITFSEQSVAIKSRTCINSHSLITTIHITLQIECKNYTQAQKADDVENDPAIFLCSIQIFSKFSLISYFSHCILRQFSKPMTISKFHFPLTRANARSKAEIGCQKTFRDACRFKKRRKSRGR